MQRTTASFCEGSTEEACLSFLYLCPSLSFMHNLLLKYIGAISSSVTHVLCTILLGHVLFIGPTLLLLLEKMVIQTKHITIDEPRYSKVLLDSNECRCYETKTTLCDLLYKCSSCSYTGWYYITVQYINWSQINRATYNYVSPLATHFCLTHTQYLSHLLEGIVIYRALNNSEILSPKDLCHLET